MKKVSSFVCAFALCLGVLFASISPVMAITKEEVLASQEQTRARGRDLSESVETIQNMVFLTMPVILFLGVVTFAGTSFKSVQEVRASKQKVSAEKLRAEAESSRVEIEEIKKATAQLEAERARLEAERSKSYKKTNKYNKQASKARYYDAPSESSSQDSLDSESIARARFVASQAGPTPVDYDGDGTIDYVA